MARLKFGGGLADWTFSGSGTVQLTGGVVVTCWSAETGGTQYTDLQTLAGAPVTSITSSNGSDGRSVGTIPPFFGPDTISEMWVSAGGGPRALMVSITGLGGATPGLAAKTVVTVARVAGADFVCDGTADDVQIQQAINAVVAAGGGTVFIKAGNYSLSAGLVVSGANVDDVIIRGEGMGATNIVCAATMTGDTPALQVVNAPSVTDLPLTVDTAVGSRTITMSPANAATLAVGGWILIKSTRIVDTESAGKMAGELKQITAINGGTGVISVNDLIFDAYTVAATASAVKLTMINNITISDLSVSTLAVTSTLSTGFLDFRFVNNLTVNRVEMHHAYHSLQLRSCINVSITDCYIHHIDEPGAGSNLRYGVWVAAASQNVIIDSCRFRQTRHAVTFGTNSGSNGNGIQRNVVVSNCVSMESDTAHFDTHQPCDGVTFIGCSAIGGMVFQAIAGQAVIGYQSRGRNVSFVGCLAQACPGRGFTAFGPVGHNTRFLSCTARDIKERLGGGEGTGFFVDSNGADRHIINGCMVLGSDSAGINMLGGADDCVITGNLIENAGRVVVTASVKFTDGKRGVFANNRIIGNVAGPPLQLSGTATNWQIHNNSFTGCTPNTPSLVGSNSLKDNIGANPAYSIAVGNVTGGTTFNLVNGAVQTATLTGNVVATVSAGISAGDTLTLILTQDATGGRTFTWPGNVLLAGGTLTVSAAANAVTVVTLQWSGTAWLETSRSLALS